MQNVSFFYPICKIEIEVVGVILCVLVTHYSVCNFAISYGSFTKLSWKDYFNYKVLQSDCGDFLIALLEGVCSFTRLCVNALVRHAIVCMWFLKLPKNDYYQVLYCVLSELAVFIIFENHFSLFYFTC